MLECMPRPVSSFLFRIFQRVYLSTVVLYRGYTLSLKTNAIAMRYTKPFQICLQTLTTLLPISFPLTAFLCRRVFGSHPLPLSTPNTRRALSLHMMHSRSRSAI